MMKKIILSVALLTSAYATDRDMTGTANPVNPRQQLQSNMNFLKQGMIANQEKTLELQKVNAAIFKLKQADKNDPRIAGLEEKKVKLNNELNVLRLNLKEKANDVQNQVKQHQANQPSVKVESSIFQKVVNFFMTPLKWVGLVK